MEHRWGRRVATGAVVRLDARPGVLAVGRLRDVSLSGGYVEGVPPLPVLTCVHVELEWGYSKRQEPCRVRAHVVRNDAGGLGLEWADFAPAAIRALAAACDDRVARVAPAGSPAILSRGVSEPRGYSEAAHARSSGNSVWQPRSDGGRLRAAENGNTR